MSIYRKSIFSFVAFGLFCALILMLSVRGLPGNPNEQSLNTSVWAGDGAVPFGSSNEQGRYALTYSFLEQHTMKFSPLLAQFSVPDLAKTGGGEYVSLFAPGVSFLVMPGYIVGKLFGASQLGSFVIVAVLALMNTLIIFSIARKLGAHVVASALAAGTFLFATPAFSYAVSLSQHHFSVFCMLFSLYLLLSSDTWRSVAIIWFLCALSVVIDNPNIFMMFPIGVLALGRIVWVQKYEQGFRMQWHPWRILTFVFMVPPLLFFGWFNFISNGNPWQLSGTLTRVVTVQPSASLTPEATVIQQPKNEAVESGQREEKSAIGFFKTRRLLGGLFTHFLSLDRGVLWYTPVILLGVFGLIRLFPKNRQMTSVLVAVIGMNILLYSLWGDPWGGWSFGSRYLIPTYALLGIGLAISLTVWRRDILFMSLFFLLFSYSAAINTLGALGTSSIPPQSAVSSLTALTQKPVQADFRMSSTFLHDEGSRAFAYQESARFLMTGWCYYLFVTAFIISGGLTLLIWLWRNDKTLRV